MLNDLLRAYEIGGPAGVMSDHSRGGGAVHGWVICYGIGGWGHWRGEARGGGLICADRGAYIAWGGSRFRPLASEY